MLSTQEKSWILYDWANSAYSIAITTAILPIYFKDVVSKGMSSHLSTAYWGYGTTISVILVAILAPILGTIADYKNYKKKFFVLFLIIGVLFTALLSVVGEGAWRLCLALYVLSSIGFSCANIFYDSFLLDITDTKRMDWISASGYAWGYLGSTIPFFFSIAIILKPSIIGLSSSIVATQLSFIITALWWLVFSLPFIKNSSQKYYVKASSHPVKDGFQRLLNTIRDVGKYREAAIFLLAYFLYIDGVDTIIRMAAIYGRDVGVGAKELLLILLVVQLVAFPFALLYGRLAKNFSAKAMLLSGIVIYIFITLFAYSMKTTLHYWILALLVATSQGGIQALSRSCFGKLIPKDRSAEFFGFYNVFGKFAAIIGPFLVALLTHITRNPRIGILSLLFLFVAGGLLLLKVPLALTPQPN
ncbi:MAG: MFS transporter [bacterium]